MNIFRRNKEIAKSHNAVIVDAKTMKRKSEHIEDTELPEGAKRWLYKGRRMYFLVRNKDTLKPLKLRKITKDTVSESELYQVTIYPQAQTLFGSASTIWDKTSLVALYVLIGASLFVTFMLVGVAVG